MAGGSPLTTSSKAKRRPPRDDGKPRERRRRALARSADPERPRDRLPGEEIAQEQPVTTPPYARPAELESADRLLDHLCERVLRTVVLPTFNNDVHLLGHERSGLLERRPP